MSGAVEPQTDGPDAGAGEPQTDGSDAGARAEAARRRREGDAHRAVVLVNNSLRAYSRANRFARSLAAAGWETTLVGVAETGLPAEEKLSPASWPVIEHGDPPATPRDVRLLRLPPSGSFAGYLHGPSVQRGLIHRLPLLGAVMRTLGWPLAARAWGVSLRDLPPADLYHACGLGAAVVARDLGRRAKRKGRAGRVVYDYIDIFQESDIWYRYPAWRRRVYPRIEAAAVRAADAMTSVSDQYAADARTRWRLPHTPLVVYNCPPREEIPSADTDLVRRATGIPPERDVVLFIGRFGDDRGLLEAGDAVLQLPDAAFVAMGFGRLEEQLRERDHDPQRAGRHFTLPPVPPEDVTRWSAGADATVFIVPGNNLNQRDMTPNKLWESLAGGAPLVVGEAAEAALGVVLPADVGVRVPAHDVAGIAAGLRRLLDVPEDERRARRERARRLMSEHYAWDVTIPRYLRVARELVERPGTAR